MNLKSLFFGLAFLFFFFINGYPGSFSSLDGKNINAPNLAYYSHIIDDDTNGESNGNGDGLAEAGESIEMPLAIINTGNISAHNVSATISCADADITITDNEEYFGVIEAGAIDWCNNDFDFDVSTACPEKDVLFILNITANSGSWTSDFTVHISEAGDPNLVFNDLVIDDDDNGDSNGDGDGLPESGESIEMPVSLLNSGTAVATGVTAILTCNDPDIVITDDAETYGTILVGQEDWCNYNFNFDISPGCPEKDVQFNLLITANEGVWNSSFTVHISDPGSPELSYANQIIDDDASGSSVGDGDGIPEAGEIVEIPIQLLNTGLIGATGVSATISTTDADINITDPFEYYPNISPGEAQWCENDYDIEISATCPEKDVEFTLLMEADQGSWTDTFVIHVSEQGTPELNFVSYVIDDDNDNNSSGNDNGLAEPGEHIELPVQLQNIGDADAHNVSAVLSTNDPDITVTDANENYGLIGAGATDWCNNEFDFYVHTNCLDKDVLFNLLITSDEGEWTSNFIVHISITGTPDIAFSDLLIDDDDNGTSNGDGDGQAEPGEQIEMPLALVNNGTAPVHNTVAVITCADADISVTDDSENYSTILPGAVVWSNLDFDFSVDYGTPEKDVAFNLYIQSDEGNWTDTFTVHIYPASGTPDLQYVNHIIDDDDNGDSNGNDDGMPAAGESIEMPVLINNIGDAAAHDISALLSCSDADINITDANESFIDLNVGESAWTNYNFNFDVSPTCPDKTVVFTLTINADEGNWVSDFSVDIIGAGVPHLVFSEYIIDDDNSGESSGDGDGLAEPGESIELPVMVSNIGNGPVHSLVGQISTTDPDINITDYYEYIGDVSEGTDAWTENDFDFDVLPNCPEKDVVFTLNLEGDEGVWVLNFTVHIYPLIYYDIITYANPTNGGTTDGDGSYLDGESCTISAVANDGHSFANWSQNGQVVTDSPIYSFLVTQDEVFIANFNINEYSVSLNAVPETGGTVAGAGIYQYGEIATVMANPNPEYTFINWTEDGTVVSSNQSYSFQVNYDVNLTAHFQGAQYVVEVTANPSNGGTVSGGGEYDNGDIATVTATPIDNFEFVNWTENGSIVSNDPSYSFEVVENRVLVANFSEDYYTITAVSVPVNGGSIEGAGNFSYGQYCNLSTTPNGGFYFIDWQEDGTTVSTNVNYSFQVTHTRSLEAHFGVFAYEITVAANPAEAGTVSGGGNFNYGDETTVAASAYPGWEFLSWTNNGSVVSNEASYTFNVTQSMNLQANFIVQEFSISALADPGSGGNISGDGVYDYGEIATLVATEATAYTFVNWTEDGDVVSIDPEFSFNVTADRSFVAHFVVQQYEVITLAEPAYGGDVSGEGTYDYGSSVTVTASPNNSYEFLGWTENGSMISNTLSYSFSVFENRTLTAVFQFVIKVDEVDKLIANAYPNPSDGHFRLRISEDATMVISDMKGQKVLEQKLSAGLVDVDLSNHADGLYFMQIITKDDGKILKLLKE